MKKVLLLLLIIGTISQSCTEHHHMPVNQGDDVPSPVQNPVVTALPGGAQISYQLPDDKSILYVKATAEIREGISREVKASTYTNSLVIDGFADTNEYTVYLRSVGYNNKESEPVLVSIKPDTPPIYIVRESIEETIQETWGGLKFDFNNPTEADIRIFVSTPDSLGEMYTCESFYSSVPSDKFSVRGFDSEKRLFVFDIQDRWGNSTTFESEVRPWHEERLDKKKFVSYELPGDMNTTISGTRYIEYIWDDKLTNDAHSYNTTATTGVPLPHGFTIDLGVKARLSRIVVHGRPVSNASFLYNAGMIKQWDIFGSNDPNPDGSYDDSWIPLKDTPFESFKPSGLPVGQYSDEDLQRQWDGEEFEFDNNEPVRYIRMLVSKVWGEASGFITIQEITLYGEVLEEYR
jgi:hypothetical protein